MTKLSADELRNLAIGADDTNTRCTDCTYCALIWTVCITFWSWSRARSR